MSGSGSGPPQGEYKWSDGDVYKGEWKDGKKHGQVRLACLLAAAPPTNTPPPYHIHTPSTTHTHSHPCSHPHPHPHQPTPTHTHTHMCPPAPAPIYTPPYDGVGMNYSDSHTCTSFTCSGDGPARWCLPGPTHPHSAPRAPPRWRGRCSPSRVRRPSVTSSHSVPKKGTTRPENTVMLPILVEKGSMSYLPRPDTAVDYMPVGPPPGQPIPEQKWGSARACRTPSPRTRSRKRVAISNIPSFCGLDSLWHAPPPLCVGERGRRGK